MIEKKAKFKNSLKINTNKQSKIIKEGVDLEQDSYNTIKKLGQGTFGEVYLITHKKEKKNMALKIIVAKQQEEEYIEKLMQEVKIHYSIQNQNVVSCYGYCLKDQVLKLALEYMDFGHLKEIITYKKILHENLLGYISYNVLKGLYCLESKKILHRDIKPSNLLINMKGDVKISDFGESGTTKEFLSYRNTQVGTLLYNSPERLTGDKYYSNCDVWSLGLIMMECANGKNPILEVQQNQKKSDFLQLENAVRDLDFPEIKGNYSDSFKSFVKECLIKDPKKRPYASKLLDHKFIKKFEKTNKEKIAQVLQKLKSTIKDYQKLNKLK